MKPHPRCGSLGPARPQINPADTHVSTTSFGPAGGGSSGAGRRCRTVAYPWTRVPKGTPPLDPLQLRLLPVADRFMGLMWSRPGGLSLRTTWVTPATIWLGIAAIGLVGLPGVGGIVYGLATRQGLLAGGGLIAVALAAGAGWVAIYGIRQRLLAGTRRV